jgi:hypothetical protein
MQIYTLKDEAIDLLYSQVTQSTFVRNNQKYMDKVSKTTIQYDHSDTINAYATMNGDDKYLINIYKGLTKAMQACSIAFTNFVMYRDSNMLKKHINDLISLIKKNKFSFNHDAFIEYMLIIQNDIKASNIDSVLRNSGSYAAGAILEVISHELGHICLEHLYDEHVSLEVSRNNERQADLFACSVIATTLYSEYMYLGSLMSNFVFAWLGDSNALATSHPHGIERLENMFNSYEYKLKEYGITRELFDEIKP